MLAAMVDRGLLVVSRPSDGDALSRTLRRQNLLAALEGMPLPADLDEPQVPTETTAAAQPDQGSGTGESPSIPAQVIPPRPEPFTPARRPDHPEPAYARAGTGLRDVSVGSVEGSAALKPDAVPVVERDPSVNKSLLLRLIAGVRGL
jgi:hypothetical protein